MASRSLSRADIVVSPTLQAIIHKLDHPLLRRDFGSIWGVERELQGLYYTMERIKAILEVVEIKQRKDGLLKLCLDDLRSEAYYIDDVLDEFLIETRKLVDDSIQTKSKNQVSYSLSFALNENHMLRRKEVGPFITEINEKLAIIEKKLKEHYFQGPAEEKEHAMLTRLQSFPSRETRRMVGSIVDERHVFGREKDVRNVRHMLLSDQYNGRDAVSVVAIVAMGGMGKTTLAQLLYNDPHIKAYFDKKAWVCVSDQFDMQRITEEILNSVDEESFNQLPLPKKSFSELQLSLHDKLKGQRFLIVLDDVWNERRADWDKLRVPFKEASKASRILVTTRSKKVSSVMSATKTYHLEGISNAVGWSLFKDSAFIDPNMNAYPNLQAIGKQIVSKCKGLPLAINTLGGLLYGSVDENEWQFILESEIWEIEEDNVLPALSLSYYHLPPHLKQCFAYCSLFPKDYIFRKETLVHRWIAEGFIQTKQVDRREHIGLQYFDDLLHRSFFQSSYNLLTNKKKSSYNLFDDFVMHDLMHDLASSVSSGICFRLERNGSFDMSEKVRHISLMANIDFDLVGRESSKFKGLSTLQCVGADVQGIHPPDGLFVEFKCLRVLVLDTNGMESLPNSVGYLKHLQYLSIHSSTMKTLPESICMLYNLQVLDIEGCEALVKLPKDISNLSDLRHLKMQKKWWEVKRRPRRLGKLTCLKRIPFFDVGKEAGQNMGELKELLSLEGYLFIKNLQNAREEEGDGNLKNMEKIDMLELQWKSSYTYIRSVALALQPPIGLKSLEIEGFPDFSYPTWMTTDISGYNKLVSVTLTAGKSLTLPSLGQLPSLKYLKILLGRMRLLNQEFYRGTGGRKGFQNLTFLRLQDMPCLEESCDAEDGEFPALQHLSIMHCPNLKRLPRLFPSEEQLELEIRYCDNLTSLYCGPNTSLKRLNISDCNGIRSFPNEFHRFSLLLRVYISNCSQLEVLFPDEFLPPMLEALTIRYCSNLKFLPKNLHKLSSLKELSVSNCMNLTSLPEEGLPKSLQDLTIEWCHKELRKRCQEGGEDWPKISGIHRVVVFPSSRSISDSEEFSSSEEF